MASDRRGTVVEEAIKNRGDHFGEWAHKILPAAVGVKGFRNADGWFVRFILKPTAEGVKRSV